MAKLLLILFIGIGWGNYSCATRQPELVNVPQKQLK